MIVDFVRILRAADIRVSPAETLEAAAIIDKVGIGDKTLLRVALGQGLAKTESEKAIFNECFESYFATPDEINSTTNENASESDEDESESKSESSLADMKLSQMLTTGDDAALQAAMMQAAKEAGISEARLFTQQGIFTRRILEAMGLDELDERLREMRTQNGDGEGNGGGGGGSQSSGASGALETLEQSRAALFESVRDFVEAQIAMRTRNAGRLLREEALSRLRLAALDKSDMALLRDLTRKLAKKLASRHVRRRKKNLRGVLDIRRTMRRNQAHDGLLFNLAWRRVKRDKPKLIVMCDVSGSVAAVAQFFLMFLYNLGDVMPRTRSFVFSNRCGEISQMMADHDIEKAMALALREYGGGSTDYGTSFTDLYDATSDDIDRHTSVLILGDARSNFGDPGHGVLREIHNKAKRVIWLNPEARVSWNVGDSEMRRLGAYCTDVHVCNSLRQVERVVDSLLKYAG